MMAKVRSKTFEIKEQKEIFDEYVQKDKDVKTEIGERLRDQIKYIQVYKNSHLHSTRDKHENDAKFAYFDQCYNVDNELFLPLLDQVHNKTLALSGYTLSMGHCNGFVRSLPFFHGFINRIILDNCGVDDGEFEAILAGIDTLKDFKKIVYRRNHFLQNSLEQMKKVLSHKIPNHLEELRIEQCLTEPQVIRDLLECVCWESSLRKLGLVEAKINQKMIEEQICDLLENSQYL